MKRISCLSILTLMILFIPTVSSASDESISVPTGEVDLVDGDYFRYNLNMDGYWSTMEDGTTIKKVVENSNTDMLISYGGTSCMQTGWEDCIMLLSSFEVNLTITYYEDVGVDGNTGIMTMKTESTGIKSGERIHDTTVVTTNQWFSVDDEPYHYEEISTSVSVEYISEDNRIPEYVGIGDTWTEESIIETTYNGKSRINGDPWEHEDEIIENETITTNSNAEEIANVFVGQRNFESLKIKDMDAGSSDYDYTYLDINGIPTKMESYEDNVLTMIATLYDYKWQNEPNSLEEESSLPGFNIVLSLTAVLLSTLAFSKSSQPKTRST